MTGIRYLTAIFTTFITSSVLAGHTTTDGCEPVPHVSVHPHPHIATARAHSGGSRSTLR